MTLPIKKEIMEKKLKFPIDTQLSKSPLIEAWLEIRWKLDEKRIPGMMVDTKYPYALGIFYDSIKDTFGFSEELPASQAPEGFLPYTVQHRFRAEVDSWPLFQIGPGIASVNYTKPYKWSDFKTMALFLREKLLVAYGEDGLQSQIVALRYRNAHPFPHSEKNILEFLRNNINISIDFPDNIINQTSKPIPSNLHLTSQYQLDEPPGIGKITIGSGHQKKDNVEIVLTELEVNSSNEMAPDIRDKDAFELWLDTAHIVIHEWFFSLVEGNLLEEYLKE
jgi:uncharacterized protein (TIGR04255 family)